MVITPDQMPSGGVHPNSTAQSFSPLTFSELLEYSEEFDSASTRLQKYLLDIKWIKKKFSNPSGINIMDLDYCIYWLKRISTMSDVSFTQEKECSEGHTNYFIINNSEVDKAIEKQFFDYKGVIELSGTRYIYEVPMLDKFEKVFDKVTRGKGAGSTKLLLIKLIACFPKFEENPNQVENLVIKSSSEDVVQLTTLGSMYFNSTLSFEKSCSTCKIDTCWSVSLDELIDNMYLRLLINGSTVESKINVEQVR